MYSAMPGVTRVQPSAWARCRTTSRWKSRPSSPCATEDKKCGQSLSTGRLCPHFRQVHHLPATSRQIEAIQVHHLVPGRNEVMHELLLRIRAAVDFGQRPELRMRAE